MSLIVNIDCATSLASVCISKEAECIAYAENDIQKEHASFLHPALLSLLQEARLTIHEIDAFAITHGPGSYTGLRVAMAAAKGLCVATNKPLITINTLQVMAHAAKQKIINEPEYQMHTLFCPMIDARRLEVFTALYDYDLNELAPPSAVIVDANFIDREKWTEKIIFSGNGSHKAHDFLKSQDIIFPASHSAKNLGSLSYRAFLEKQFADIAYSEPFYLKDFYFAHKASKS